MRINPISVNLINLYKSKPINPTYYVSPVIQTQSCDTVSFKSSAKNGETLKALLKYGIPDIYTGRTLLDPAKLQEFLNSGIFSKSVKEIVNTLKPYKQCLHPVESQVFSTIEAVANYQPDRTLTSVIKFQVPEANKKIVEVQKTVFKELDVLAKNLPENVRNKYYDFMEKTQDKINKRSIKQEFSRKQFRYKLERIKAGIKSRNIQDEVFSMDRIIKLADTMRISKKESSQKINQRVMRKIYSYLQKSALRNDKELNDLISISKNQILGFEQKIVFRRKEFIYDLQEIVKDIEDKKLAHKMVQKARKIPTSHQSIDAFYTKEAESSPDKIGYDLLINCAGTIDHIIPKKSGGANNISNYVLASSYYNSERGHSKMETQIRKNPQMYKNCQYYVDKLIQLANKGVFEEIGLDKSYITGFAKKMYELSPKERPMILDTSKLMMTIEERNRLGIK